MKRFLWVAAVVLGTMIAGTGALSYTAKAQASTQAPAPATGAAGKWHFVLDTPGGDREVDADFTVDADGKVSGTFGKDTAAGTFKDGELKLGFQMTSEEAGETAQMTMTGKMADPTTMSGDWVFSSYSGAFKAMRPKP